AAMGVAPYDVRRFGSLRVQREVLVLVTVPTVSGKTTTLYAALREISERGVNIVTVEDPIEYRLPGIVQVQVHERAGLTFGAALRSIMRQDPDVILVGEIRDRETAEIAIQASLTGHLVLSSLHTNDAASAVTRLVDIGVPGYKIATAVKGVIAQRLIRRVCPECDATGCPACERTGYRGRLAIAEVLIASPEFERQVAAGAPTESIAECARSTGCSSLWESGMALVRSGATTADELRRVAAAPVSLVTEPRFRALPPSVSPPDMTPSSSFATPSSIRVRIAWMTGAGEVGAHSLRDDLQAAAAVLGGRVDVVTVVADAAHSEALSSVDAIILDEPGMVAAAPPRALVVAFATGAARDEAVRTLARDADVVLPADSSGRELLASILALLRWRSRG
ncbi:MAG: Flp pilus assembly complex ATPase component TadA, partial [Gemmatimonadaceae bacterium]|nr:Flp pilus assembly complex ATPase component TadA [Gemmatimonadaceae bacterium]